MFDLTIAMIVSIAEQAFNSRAARYIAHTEQYGEPTVDKNGRKHAPHNGFVWIDDNVYAGGEYLPEEEYTISGTTIRYITTTEIANTLKEQIAPLGVDVGCGKIFNDTDCYAYISGPGYILNKLPRPADKVIVEDGTFPTGKVWKFSFKRWINAHEYELIHIEEYKRLESLNKKMVGYYRPRLVK
jgi:hypothetical protein